MNIFCTRIIIGYMLKYKEHIFERLSRWCIALTKAEKIRKIQEVLELKNPQENLYADLLKTMGDLKTNYGDYMIT